MCNPELSGHTWELVKAKLLGDVGPQLLRAYAGGEATVTGQMKTRREPVQPVRSILTPVGEPVLVEAVERFEASVMFRPNTADGGVIESCTPYFLDHVKGVVEWNVSEARLQTHEQRSSFADVEIYAAFGGNDRAQVAYAHMYEFLNTAPHATYVFYLRTMVAFVYWNNVGWRLTGHPTPSETPWPREYLFVVPVTTK